MLTGTMVAIGFSVNTFFPMAKDIRKPLKIIKCKAQEILKPELSDVNEDLKNYSNTAVCIF